MPGVRRAGMARWARFIRREPGLPGRLNPTWDEPGAFSSSKTSEGNACCERRDDHANCRRKR